VFSTYCLLGIVEGIWPVKNPVVENPSIYLGTSVWPIQMSVMLDICGDEFCKLLRNSYFYSILFQSIHMDISLIMLM